MSTRVVTVAESWFAGMSVGNDTQVVSRRRASVVSQNG